MSINKPEIVCFTQEQTAYRLAHNYLTNNLCYSRKNTLADIPLIRLSDYEARIAVLFDGHAVYNALAEKTKQYTSPQNVAAVLDSVIKLMSEVSNDKH